MGPLSARLWELLQSRFGAAMVHWLPITGRLAQRLAQVPYTHKAGGSNPSSPTIEIAGRTG